MSDWKDITVADIVEKVNTGLDAIQRAPIVFYNSGVKCLRIQDVSQSKNFDDWGFCEVTDNNYSRFQLKKGDIIIARTGATIGVNLLIQKDLNAVYNNGLIRIIVDKQKTIPEYLYYNFRSINFRNYIESISGGTSTQPNMQINALVDYEMKLPPLSEQTDIASVLSSLDDKIDLLHRQNKTLEQLAETLFRQWFVEEAKESWVESSLFNTVEILGGGTPKTEVAEYWNGEIDWISGKDITPNHKQFIVSTEKRITKKGLENSSTRVLPKFSTVISTRGTVGKTCILASPMAFSQTNYGIVPRYKDCYFFTYLLIEYSIEELQSASYGTVFDTITTNTFREHKVQIPTELEIQEFESTIKPYFTKMLANINQIRTLIRLRDTLLPKLMSGEVRVKS